MLRIGTRGSRLALWQANYMKDALAELGEPAELVIIKTQGDRVQHLTFDKLEGKGFFTKELEDELLAGTIDLAVHSLKDLPTTQPDGLSLAAVSYREDPADWLLINPAALDPAADLRLRAGAAVGTSSSRRKAQLLDLRPDLKPVDIRGNVPTRADKARTGEVDAVMLAAAGLTRLHLEMDNLIVVRLHPTEFVPAPAQGVMAVQVKSDRTDLRRRLLPLHRADVAECTNVERGVLKLLQGGCQTPLGVHCYRDEQNNYHASAAIASAWDAPVRRVRYSSTVLSGMAEEVVKRLRT